MKKRVIAVALAAAVSVMALAGCGKEAQSAETLEGSCEEILNQVYADAKLDSGLREALEDYYQTNPIDESSEMYILGTDAVDYTDSACSAPLMTSIAYQCVILRLDAEEDVQTAKQQLLDNADPIKWICVEAESVVVENVGDVVLYVMADAQTADAIKTAFLALGE